MSILEHFVGTPWAGTIGWALLHSLWEGAMIAALLGAALLAFRSPRARYAAACAAMLALLAAFAFTLIHLTPEQSQNGRFLKPPILPLWNAFSENNNSASWSLTLSTIAPWLGPVWFTGVWFLCLWRSASWVFVQRLRRRGLCCPSDHWLKKIADFRVKLRVSRPVLLMQSCLTEVPVVLGHFRPMVLVPIGLLTGLPAQQVEAILLHELAHISRHDYLVNILQRLAETAFFYHPAVWWISGVIRTERENCCDDLVVSITGNAHEYAVALAALEENRLSNCEPALAATGGHLMRRIHRLLRPQKPQSAWAVSLALVIFLATAAASFAAWQSQVPAPKSAASQVKTDGATPSLYSKWLDEDVVYIIDDAERGAFLQLTTDAERNHFIEQFWERRNPTPGSATNKFKDEHYRRIAYANQHFRTASGASGWHTDRGHIYIVYGPPDEIDSHPKGPARPLATESWLYRHVEGVGNNESITFIDRTGRGDFQLAPGNPIADAKPESLFRPATKFVLGDLKLEGEVHDRDGVRTRVLQAWKEHPFDDLKELVGEVLEVGIRKDFQERGYFKVLVHDPVSKPLGSDGGNERVLLVASVTEGPQFQLGVLGLQNAAQGQPLDIPVTTLRDQFRLQEGDVFNVSEIRRGLERVAALYKSRGYEDVLPEPDAAIHEKTNRIDFTVRITEGPRKSQ